MVDNPLRPKIPDYLIPRVTDGSEVLELTQEQKDAYQAKLEDFMETEATNPNSDEATTALKNIADELRGEALRGYPAYNRLRSAMERQSNARYNQYRVMLEEKGFKVEPTILERKERQGGEEETIKVVSEIRLTSPSGKTGVITPTRR